MKLHYSLKTWMTVSFIWILLNDSSTFAQCPQSITFPGARADALLDVAANNYTIR
jgi:hypothetical protein